MTKTSPFNDSGVLITGGTSGLGAEAARAFAALGAHVVVAGRSADKGAAVAAEIGGRFAATDVTDEEQVRAAVALATQAPRGLRAVVSAAGSAAVAKTLGRSGPHPLDVFRAQLETNLIGAFNVLRLGAAAMDANEPDADGGRGVVVLTSSVAGYEGQMGQVAYAAAKGGINSMVLPAARDLARRGIRVLGVAPGVFDTPFMDILSDEAKAGIGASVPFPNRLGKPSEYADLVVALAANPMVNGEVVRLDGALRLGLK